MLAQPTRNAPRPTSPFRPRAAGLAALAAITLSLYFGVVHAFSFHPPSSPSAKGINLAILAMDVLLAVHVAWGIGALVRGRLPRAEESPRSGLSRRSAQREGGRSPARWAFYLLATISLAGVVALHADYLVTRHRGTDSGLAGSLVTIKILVLAAQLSALLFLGLGRSRARSLREVAGLFAPGWRGVVLLSVVLAPLVNYLAHNLELFSLAGLVEYLALFLLPPLAALALLTFFERTYDAGPAAAPFVASLAFLYYSMPLVCAVLEKPVEALFAQQAALALVLSAGLALAYRASPGIASKTIGIAVACSITASLLQATLVPPGNATPPAPAAVSAGSESEHEPMPAGLSPAKSTPDVYLLIYDGYAAPKSLREYGCNDGWEAGYLGSRGFRIYENAYSLFLSTRRSMGSLMNLGGAPSSAGIGGDNRSIRFFREHGYEVNLVLNSYILQGSNRMAADFVFPPWAPRSSLGLLYRSIAGGEFKSEIVFQDFEWEEWLATKRRVLSGRSGRPRMLYAHSRFPNHSQNSGACLPDETERYLARLEVARKEIEGDIAAIDASGREAIVIVAGDHGPYLTGDCHNMTNTQPDDLTATHLRDRYGTLLAIRWPHSNTRTDRIEVIQEVFLAVAASLLDDDRVWDHRVPAVTAGDGGIPHGAVRDGIVMVGKDKGRPLM